VVIPYLEEIRQEGDRIRFLFHFGPEFEGFTPSAAWEDMRTGLRYLRELNDAIKWMIENISKSLDYQILSEKGVVVLQPKGKLGAEDFDLLETDVDAWIDDNDGKLKGVVIETESLPGWKDLGSALRHLRFVRDHQNQVRRLALVSDSKLLSVTPKIGNHFLDADVRNFDSNALETAISWAAHEYNV
jgi:hypothetical protein